MGTGKSAQFLQDTFPIDPDGVVRVHNTVTAALAQCVTGRGDYIFLAPDFTTALTAAELLSAETKGVAILPTGKYQDGLYFENRAETITPATTQAALFTVTGKVKIISIIVNNIKIL